MQNIGLLTDANKIFREKCVSGITANEEVFRKHVYNPTASVTAMIPKISYTKASEVAGLMKKNQIAVKEAVLLLNLITTEEFDLLITPDAVTRFGY